MTSMRKDLARSGLVAALDVRKQQGRNLTDPICVYDLAEEMNVELWFADIPSLEGMYANAPRPAIIIGSERPAGRRAYTCGHELGHHQFGHGTRVDELVPDDEKRPFCEPEEFLVQSFSGFLLMPKLAVCHAFAIRGWKTADASPVQLYKISNLFGVTYGALISHMAYAIGLLTRDRADRLREATPVKIRAEFITDPKRQLIMVDNLWTGRAIDAEVGDIILAPLGAKLDGQNLVHLETTSDGEVFEAERPGSCRLACSNSGWASFVRVSRHFYVGRSVYRHFEEVEND
jgi:Zn-dependent peptidase ImmA (M78 family)